jgi:hypothetical protein
MARPGTDQSSRRITQDAGVTHRFVECCVDFETWCV